jgi:hypothetical protein
MGIIILMCASCIAIIAMTMVGFGIGLIIGRIA